MRDDFNGAILAAVGVLGTIAAAVGVWLRSLGRRNDARAARIAADTKTVEFVNHDLAMVVEEASGSQAALAAAVASADESQRQMAIELSQFKSTAELLHRAASDIIDRAKSPDLKSIPPSAAHALVREAETIVAAVDSMRKIHRDRE